MTRLLRSRHFHGRRGRNFPGRHVDHDAIAIVCRAGDRGKMAHVAVTVTDAPDRERFEARDDHGNVMGVVTYQLTGDIIVYTHTEVAPEHEGEGIGSQLARAVMDDARSRGRSVVPSCPHISKWLRKHHEYDDIVVRKTKRLRDRQG